MAIKYYPVPEKRQVVAVMSNTKFDVVNKINKILMDTDFAFCSRSKSTWDKYMMPDEFRVVLTCDERDEYDIEEGKKIAKKKLMRNYYRSVDKRLAKFKESLAEMVYKVNF